MPPPFDLLPLMLRGLRYTVELTLASAAIAFCMAFLAGLGRTSKYAGIRYFVALYIEFFRGTSLLIQLFWIFFALPLLGISFPPFTAGALALGLNFGAYGAEVVRGAIMAVPKGPKEAAIALNFLPVQRMWLIILPQAIVTMLPPFGNLIIELLKATSLVSLISIRELTFTAYIIRTSVGRSLEIFVLLLLIYFIISRPLTFGVRWLERQHRWSV